MLGVKVHNKHVNKEACKNLFFATASSSKEVFFPVGDDSDTHLQMAQWEQLLRLDLARQNQVTRLYEGRFPREIRHWLHDIIESQDW